MSLEHFAAHRALMVHGVGSVDVTESVPTARDEFVVGVAVVGPIYGHLMVCGDGAPDVQGDLMFNLDHAAKMIAVLMTTVEEAGHLPALTAQVDRERAELRDRARKMDAGE